MKNLPEEVLQNIQFQLNWDLWNQEEQDLFTMCFFEKYSTNSAAFAREKMKLARILFGKIDTTDLPNFLVESEKNLSKSNASRLSMHVDSTRKMLSEKSPIRIMRSPE